jgi:hypothetical protein
VGTGSTGSLDVVKPAKLTIIKERLFKKSIYLNFVKSSVGFRGWIIDAYPKSSHIDPKHINHWYIEVPLWVAQLVGAPGF